MVGRRPCDVVLLHRVIITHAYGAICWKKPSLLINSVAQRVDVSYTTEESDPDKNDERCCI